MSRNRKRRQAIRWARYINRYDHIRGSYVLTDGAVKAWSAPGRYWGYVRRQVSAPSAWSPS